MAISKQRKDELVTQYIEQLQKSKGVILADYRGLSVSNAENIRHTLHPIGGKFQVIKNRLMILALKEMNIPFPEELLLGPTVAGFCFNEVQPVAKVFTDTVKDLDALRIKGGLIGASVMTAAQVLTIADLPSREVLLGQVLGTINAPASQVVGVVAGGIRQIVNILQAYVDKLEESSGAPGAVIEQVAQPA